MLHDCETEPGAVSVLLGARLIDAIEALENTWQIFFADADSIIAYAQHNLFVAAPGHQRDLTVLARIFDRVIEQIIQSFLQPHPISVNHGQVGRNVDSHAELFIGEFLFPIANQFFEKARQINVIPLQIGIG